MMKSEVTQQLYSMIKGENPSKYISGISLRSLRRPVEQVSWYDAVTFANALSKKEGLEQCYQIGSMILRHGNVDWEVSWPKGVNCTGWRLPTEAEWEYAARGGEEYKYAGSNDADEVTHLLGEYTEPQHRKPHTTCSKKVNGYGLCDMSGNVEEWCWDRYDTKDYSYWPMDPSGPTSGSWNDKRVIRGGSWAHRYTSPMRVSNRGKNYPRHTESDTGFRLVRPL